jgi:hypothetical protein
MQDLHILEKNSNLQFKSCPLAGLFLLTAQPSDTISLGLFYWCGVAKIYSSAEAATAYKGCLFLGHLCLAGPITFLVVKARFGISHSL